MSHLRAELDAIAARGALPPELIALRERLGTSPAARGPGGGRNRLMDALILGLYAFFVWLIFFKFKWLPWNTTSMVIVITIPVVALTLMILLLNVFAPSSADVRVIKPVVNVVPQVGGRVLEVPVEPNRLVKKGEVLFRIDPTPYELAVKGLEAQLANAEASARELDEQLGGAGGGLAAARGAVQQAEARVHEVQAKLDFTLKRVEDNRELVRRGAGDRFALETAETDAKTLMAQLETARGVLAQSRGNEVQAAASERQVRQRIGGKVGNVYAPVAQVRAQLDNARWQLSQTTVVAPVGRLCDQRATARRLVHRRLPDHAGDDLRREHLPGDRVLPARTSCTRSTRATKPNSFSR